MNTIYIELSMDTSSISGAAQYDQIARSSETRSGNAAQAATVIAANTESQNVEKVVTTSTEEEQSYSTYNSEGNLDLPGRPRYLNAKV